MTFEIRIENTGTTAATNLFLRDPFPTNAAYVAGTMSWSLNSGPFTALTDANDGAEGGGADGRSFATYLEFRLASLGASQDVSLRFRVKVNAGTAGQFLTNQGTYASDQTTSTVTNPVQVPILGNAIINGRVFLDADGNGVQNGGELGIPNIDVVVSTTPPNIYTCTPGAAIPDDGYDGTQGSMACCALNVPAADFGATPLITDLNVNVAATHTWVGDMTIKVFGPGGLVLALLNRPGSTVPDDSTDTPYGNNSDWNGATVTFDDQGGGPSAETLGVAGTDICSGTGSATTCPARIPPEVSRTSPVSTAATPGARGRCAWVTVPAATPGPSTRRASPSSPISPPPRLRSSPPTPTATTPRWCWVRPRRSTSPKRIRTSRSARPSPPPTTRRPSPPPPSAR